MRTVAVIGAHGYVGSAICAAIASSKSHTTVPVTRDTLAEVKKRDIDILINCSMPSARFRAKNEPMWDFKETVEKTADLLYGVRYKKFVQISSVSARCQLDTVYGRHKAAAEKLCEFGDNLIVRLGPIYSPGLAKGVLVDMAQGKKVFVDGNSKYCFAPLAFSAAWVASNLHRSGTFEVGGKNAITLKDAAKHLGKDIEFEGGLDHQEVQDPEPGFPEASEVLAFLDSWKTHD